MINKEEFLKTCNLTEDDLTAARISWEELTEIYEDYMSEIVPSSGKRICR